MQNDKTIWVSDQGDVVCCNHAGHYLKSAITKRPKAISHKTPLDSWSKYSLDFPGALPCMVCVDWSTIEIPA
jgi:hypothetical protein